MPDATGLQIDLEAYPAVCRHCVRPAVGRPDRHGAQKIIVAITSAKLLRLLRPCRGYLAAADNVVRFYLENIGKITAYGNLKLEVDPLHAVVGDVDVFVHASVDHSADHQAERALRDNSPRRGNFRIGQISPRGVGGDRSAVQQVPMFAVRIDPPTADNAGIQEIEAPFAWPVDLAVRFGDQHCLPVMDRYLMRADLNLEWHRIRPSLLNCQF
jgi:hypothetical protein